MRAFALYVISHQLYLRGEYAKSLGMAETALMINSETYPIPEIYLHLIAVMDCMSLKRTDEAREHLLAAWELARPDDLIEAFGEHHGLLGGMLESAIKKDWPDDFKRIIDITYRFSAGWRRVHNPATEETVADNLDEIFRIQTMPGENTPVRSSYYEENMESYEEQMAYLRESLESAEDEETRATYEQRIAEMEGYMQEYEEESSWDVSAASIDNYRGYAENMVVPSNMNDAEFYELRMQYVDGLIGMDEMISKMDQRLTMMRMEGY